MKTILNPKLPRMAWFVEISEDSIPRYLEHGASVHVSGDFVFEGTFNLDIKPLGILNSNVCLGSGFVRIGGDTTFITPSHTLEGLFVVRNENRTFVSNSNVIAYHLADLIPTHLAVKIGWRIKYGIDNMPQQIEKTENSEILKISFHNFRFDGAEVQLVEKSHDPEFENFSQYFDYLAKTGTSLIENLKEMHGAHWSLMGTVSTGFDSVACLALGKKLGCTKAVTLCNGRGNVDDNGAPIAHSIGIECEEFLRPFSEQNTNTRLALDYSNLSDCAEFVSAGTLAEDVCYLPFETSIANTMVLTGFQADKSWGRKFEPSSNLERGDVSGSSMGEFRLRVGFVHWPVPYLGCRSNKNLLKITLSDEMHEYRDTTNYNKPIAIRMADSAGIPRELYGLKKKAASVLFDEAPTALPVSIYRQQVKYGLCPESSFDYSECINLCASRLPRSGFTHQYHKTYQSLQPRISNSAQANFQSDSIDVHVFGRTVGLVSMKLQSGTCMYDGLGGFIQNMSTIDETGAVEAEYLAIKTKLLPLLRAISNKERQYIHFQYLKKTGEISAIYREDLQFEGDVDYYLGSLWQGEKGVV